MSKFHKREEYLPLQQYQLLPFNLDRFSDTEYIVTNMVNQAINHQLSVDSKAYADLRAKHFLKAYDDKAPIDLLALKLRTKLSRLSNFTNLHIFVVTLRCDHSCPCVPSVSPAGG